MSKISTNISLNADLKKAGQELFSDLGMNLSTAVTIFIKQALRVQGLPFAVVRENPNAETAATLNEYYMQAGEERLMYEREASEEGREEGKERINSLILKLAEPRRKNDITRAAEDRTYQEELFREFGL